MAFRLSMKVLSTFSRQMAVMLEAGLPIRRALATVERGARPDQKQLYKRLGHRLESGQTFSEALEREGRVFPELYLRLARVGETVGGLDRVMKRMADYYEFVRKVWVRLLLKLIWPAIEYWGLVFVIAILIYVRTYFQATMGQNPHGDPLSNALNVLYIGVVIFCAPFVLYYLATRVLGGSKAVHEFLIHVPLVGPITRTIAIARFSWAMELMTAAGVRILDAIQWSLEATTNKAYSSRAPGIIQRVEGGMRLHEALRGTGLFPDDYTEMVAVSEESGSMPDIFARLARHYFEKMDTALKALATAAFWLIWILVASVIIYVIFRVALAYAGMIGGLTGM